MSDSDDESFASDAIIHALLTNKPHRILDSRPPAEKAPRRFWMGEPVPTKKQDWMKTEEEKRKESTGFATRAPNGPVHFHLEGMDYTGRVQIKGILGRKAPPIAIDDNLDNVLPTKRKETKKKVSIRSPEPYGTVAASPHLKRSNMSDDHFVLQKEELPLVEGKEEFVVQHRLETPIKETTDQNNNVDPMERDKPVDFEENVVPSKETTSGNSSNVVPTTPVLDPVVDVDDYIVWTEEFEKYCVVGEKILQEATAKAPESEFLPDLCHPKKRDFCLIDVESLLSSGENIPPKPVPFGKLGDHKYGKKGFVSLPWDEAHISRDGILLYAVIERELHHVAKHGLHSIYDFEALMELMGSSTDVSSVVKYYGELPTERHKASFLGLLRRIAELALRGKELFPGSLPVLDTPPRRSSECSVSLSQEQCACLLACAFFGLFSKRKNFNSFNMTDLFRSYTPLASQKLKFIIAYFSSVLTDMPSGVVSFGRRSLSVEDMVPLLQENHPLAEVGIGKGGIEDCHHALQVDFANEFIGGGVFRRGAVQEEIRFLCSPELMVSCLLCPRLKANEAVFIVGSQRYSSHSGYASTLRHKKLEAYVNKERDKFRRIRCEVVAMDAICYNKDRSLQFRAENIDRETKKALVAFLPRGSVESPIATGNWGCGAFKGDVELKAIVQLVAASAAGRPLVYCPFGEEKTAVRLCQLRDILVKENELSASLLLEVIRCKYDHPSFSIFDYIFNLLRD